MANFITNYLRARKRRQLLELIDLGNPQLADVPADQRIGRYIMEAMDVYVEHKDLYEKACAEYSPEQRAGTGLAEAPVMPWLLAESIKWYPDQPAYVYYMLTVQQELQLIRLRKQVEMHEQLEVHYKRQEEIANELADIAEAANNKVIQTNQAIKPENRMN